MKARKALLAVAIIFAVFETIDIPHTGIPAAVVASLFYLLATWFWRRQSLVASILVGLLCLLEATQAHTYKGVSMPLKIVSTTVGIIGVAAAVGVLLDRIRSGRRLQEAHS